MKGGYFSQEIMLDELSRKSIHTPPRTRFEHMRKDAQETPKGRKAFFRKGMKPIENVRYTFYKFSVTRNLIRAVLFYFLFSL